MKRYILAVALVALVLAAGAAFLPMEECGIEGRGCSGGGSFPYRGQAVPGMYGSQGDQDHHMIQEGYRSGSSNRGGGWNNSSFPKEISDMMTEMHKSNLDMRR